MSNDHVTQIYEKKVEKRRLSMMSSSSSKVEGQFDSE